VTSDKRYKTDIATLQTALDTVKQLRGVKYSWRCDEFPDKGFSTGVQSGFIAQEVEQVIPDAVVTAADGFKKLRMSYVIPYLVEAVKLQDVTITKQDATITEQQNTLTEQGKAAKLQDATITELQNTVKEQQNTVKEQGKLIAALIAKTNYVGEMLGAMFPSEEEAEVSPTAAAAPSRRTSSSA